MEHIFPAKTAALVANGTITLSWGATDIGPRFNESIIKKPVAVRFSCSTNAVNSVYCGVRYSTLTKDYLVAERKTLFFIPAGGSTDVTPASKPALGLLNENIVSISLDLTSPVAGNVTITLIIDDEPPPLSSDPGALIGLDARFALDYIVIAAGGVGVNQAAGFAQLYVNYTVPNGKRLQIDTLYINLSPTPSFPNLLFAQVTIGYTAFATFGYYTVRSQVDQYTSLIVPSINTFLQQSDTLTLLVTNVDTTDHLFDFSVVTREIF